MLIREPADINALEWEKMDGLVPAIVQDAFDGRVLMQAYMSRESLLYSLENSSVTFWSRSRQKLWNKGESSGHFQQVKSMHFDCDGDAVLIKVDQVGVVCHTGRETCFFNQFM